MSTYAPPELESFADWIQATDDHAQHHLDLLSRVARALDTSAATSPAERAGLAQKVERWRYQHLNEHAGALTPQDEALIDSLDGVARQLAGRGHLAPRRTRHAVHDPELDTGGVLALVTDLLGLCVSEGLIPRVCYDLKIRRDDGFGVCGYRVRLETLLEPYARARIGDLLATALIPWNRAVGRDTGASLVISLEVGAPASGHHRP